MRNLKKVIITQKIMLTKKINELRRQIADNKSPFMDDLERIEADLNRMSQFYFNGNSDPELENIYEALKRRIAKLETNVNLYGLSKGNPFFQRMVADTRGNYTFDLDDLRNRLEDFVVDLTMLELETDEAVKASKRKEIFANHHEYRKSFFAKLFLAPALTKEQAETIEETVLSSSIDSVDARILVSVLFLSCLSIFDSCKADILYNVYAKSDNEMLKQSAIVSYLLCLLFSDDNYDVCRNPVPEALITSVQRQFIYTLDTPRLDRIMEQEIMPDVIKNSEFDFKNNKIIRREKDNLEDILHPNKDEEAMERMEAAMNKMKRMQEQGNDLFFSGFRHAKHHPFFNTVLNWFCPFYIDHPQLPTFNNEDDLTIATKMVKRTPFCESDKYSFVISMHSAISTIPDNIRSMILQGDAQLDVIGADIERDEAYMRRIYMQDIFRFFKLNPLAKNLRNPLDPTANCMFIMCFLNKDEKYDKVAISVCKTLRKHGQEASLIYLIRNWKPMTTEGRIFNAFSLMQLYEMTLKYDDLSEAVDLFHDVLRKDEHNMQALFGLTKAYFMEIQHYKVLFDVVFKKKILKCLLALHFKNEEDVSVLHNLVRAYIMFKDWDNALKYSHELVEKGKAEPFVFVFLGGHSLSEGKIKQGVRYFKQASGKSVRNIFTQAIDMGFDISELEQDLIENIIEKG